MILAEGVELPEDIVQTAQEKGINVLSSNQPIYETAVQLAGLVS